MSVLTPAQIRMVHAMVPHSRASKPKAKAKRKQAKAAKAKPVARIDQQAHVTASWDRALARLAAIGGAKR